MNLNEREQRWLLTEKYNNTPTEAYNADLSRLNAGEPLAYIIGNIPFCDCIINLNHKPLIPRTETEFFTHNLLGTLGTKLLRARSPQVNVLDIFAGSGCIGIAIAKHLPNANVSFAEIDPDFVKQIHENLQANSIDTEKTQVFESNMLEKLPARKYNIIVANPPYIAHNKRSTVQDSVHAHENHDSLYTEDEGLYFVKKLIRETLPLLLPMGELYIEFDPWQVELITSFLGEQNITKYEFINDQYEKPRFLKITN